MMKNVKTVTDEELDDLVSDLGENRLPLRKSCMEGTRTTILQEIGHEIKNFDGPSMIWIREPLALGNLPWQLALSIS